MQPVCDDYFKELEAPAGPSSMHLNAPVRAYLEAVRQHLLGLHDAGVASRSVNEEHADLMDRLVRKLFRLAEDRYFENFPRLNFRLAVIAVGGYGRRELSLGSDIDLLFLHQGKLNPYVETIAEAITHRLWDARLSVGAATRTLKDCMKVGRADLSTMTSYLDARFLVGDPELFSDLDTEVKQHLKRHTQDFIAAKLEEQRLRHERMGESLFLLQPNVRESVGGLRDYHTALWLARAVQWDVRRAEHLQVHGFVDGDELAELMAAVDFIWRLRNELHRGGRKDDRLHYEAQARLAAVLGIRETDETLAAERLMQSYYASARAIARISRQVVVHARRLAERRRGRRERPPFATAEGFAIAAGELEIPSASLIEERPMRLLSAFAVAQEHDAELSPRAQRLLRQHAHLIDDAFRDDPEAAELFARILRAPHRVYRTLGAMSELGVLGAYLPEFAHLVGRWQQDLYHTYTVDVHSLFLVEQLRRMGKGRLDDELPLPSELMREVQDPRTLYLSCILHDIGKGHGGGHSQKGANMTDAICKRLVLDQAEGDAVRFLVRHHLTMSEMAEQRDVHDPRQILKLANLARTREQLRNLYLLTVADIRSVSPEAWNTWKGGLLEALYRNAAEWLETGEEDPSQFFLERASEGVQATEREVVEHLSAAGRPAEEVEEFLAGMPRRYLLAHSASEIEQHVAAALDFAGTGAPIGVAEFVPPGERAPFWGIVVMGRDQPGLFATVCGVLTACGHDILGAQVYTARTLAVEIYEVRPISGGHEERETERARLESSLLQVISGARSVDALLSARRAAPAPVARRVVPAVEISNDESDFYTVIDVATNDRPALLYDITRTLAACDLNVVSSRASTRARQAKDAFYVTQRGRKITDPDLMDDIRNKLLEAVRRGAG